MEILPSILGNRGRPSKDNRAFLVAVFHALANGLRRRALPIEHGKWWGVDAKFNRWAQGGSKTELFEQLKQRSKALIWMHGSRQWETISRQWEPRAETNASAGRPAARQRRFILIVDAHGNPLDFTITAGNVHDSKETCNLIQILEEKYLSKVGEHDAEERGQRDFLGDKGCAGSVIKRIPAVQGRISARPSRNNSQKPKTIDKRIDQERRPVESDYEKIKKARGVSTGCAKTVSMFAAFVTLACSYAWLKLLVEWTAVAQKEQKKRGSMREVLISKKLWNHGATASPAVVLHQLVEKQSRPSKVAWELFFWFFNTAQTTPTGEGINTSRILSQKKFVFGKESRQNELTNTPWKHTLFLLGKEQSV